MHTTLPPLSAISIAQLLQHAAQVYAKRIAIASDEAELTYEDLFQLVWRATSILEFAGVTRGSRVLIHGKKSPALIVAILAVNAMGAIFVPINPQLRSMQVLHILRDAKPAAVVTSHSQWNSLFVEGSAELKDTKFVDFSELLQGGSAHVLAEPTDADPAAILYTSGSTGLAKGVVLSQRNLMAGALSVASYLRLGPDDRILGVLPLSFDAGLSQWTTALAVGATYVPLNYLHRNDAIKACERFGITVITGVPPLWLQLVGNGWDHAGPRLRVIANTGGHMPARILEELRHTFSAASMYLMYGLTEAFRSTYLDPAEISLRPDSIGKAVPNAEIFVLRSDGSECEPDEEGELVHRGAFVALGYWNDPALTAERFRPIPGRSSGLVRQELAVWSGDIVKRDRDGFLYFVGRRDDMIKSQGYRVSPTEVEEAIYAAGVAKEVAVLGVQDAIRGQTILAIVNPPEGIVASEIEAMCRKVLPGYMQPSRIVVSEQPLPRNPNGKIDRSALRVSQGLAVGLPDT